MYVDSHCHFDFHRLCPDVERAALWARARMVGVMAMVIPGVCPDQWHMAQRWAKELPGVSFAVGLHPYWQAQGQPFDQLLAEHMAQSSRCVAIGECGVDARLATAMSVQIELTRQHIVLANSVKLPVILHCVAAHAPLLALLKRARPQYGGVIHGFSGSRDIAREYWRLGLYLGVGGVITHERARKTRAAIAAMPLSALLLETDAPDMAPVGSEHHSPRNIPLIAAQLANLHDVPLATIAAQTTCNAQTLFAF